MKNSLQQFYRRGPRGSIAVLTLWSILFLALLSLSLSKELAGRLMVSSDMKWGPKVRALGAKALADSAMLIRRDKNAEYDSLRDLSMGAALFEKVSYGGGSYSIVSPPIDSSAEEGDAPQNGLTDEERRINLNRAAPEVISRLLQIKGDLSAIRADELANSIADWRDTDTARQGSPVNSEDCAYLSPPARCKNGDFEVLEELFWIPGMTPVLFERIKEDLTLYGAGPCNINTATVTSLRAFGLSPGGAQKVAHWRSAGNVFENLSWITGRSGELKLAPEDQQKLQAAASSGFLGIRSDFYRGLVETEFGGRVRGRVRFLINRKGEIQSWRE
ncbi:MAG: general secretion pathway protein GspK [Deltaproteobacteria bacterium]|nr:general secretion pathway protein GspK [Deltaproteobacteria bacterium]